MFVIYAVRAYNETMEHIFTQNLDIPNVLKDKATSILATHCPDEYFNDLLYVRVLGCSTGG